MKVKINRDTWLRGQGGSESYLRRKSDEKMCCLGFAAFECGVELSDIVDHRTPYDFEVGYNWPVPPTWNGGGYERLMNINDDLDLTEIERERKLIGAGKEVGLEFEFYGGAE